MTDRSILTPPSPASCSARTGGRFAPIRALGVATVLTLTACDTGDGTTLMPTTAPTTLPPVDTTPLPSVPIATGPTDSALVVPSVPDVASTGGAATNEPTPSGSSGAQVGGEFELFAPWAEGGPIDTRYGCDGSNVSPPISWVGVPDGTAELAIALVDESNLSNGRPFVHWVMGGIDPGDASMRLAEGEVPAGAIQGINFFGDVAYAGPCPDPGSINDYRLTLFALQQQLELADGTPAAEFLDVVEAVAIDSDSVVGTSTR